MRDWLGKRGKTAWDGGRLPSRLPNRWKTFPSGSQPGPEGSGQKVRGPSSNNHAGQTSESQRPKARPGDCQQKENVCGPLQGCLRSGSNTATSRSQQKVSLKEADSMSAQPREAEQFSPCRCQETWKSLPASCLLTSPFSLERGELRKGADGPASFTSLLRDKRQCHL